MPHATNTDADRNYSEFIVERPMVGYGMEPPKVEWPGQSKIAVSFVINYTEGAERSPEYGDATSENLFADLTALGTRDERDDMVESEWEYGPRMGLPRLLALFERYNLKATVNVCTAALEKAPYWGQKLAANPKLELSCASKRWLDYFEMDPREEEQHINEAIDSLQKLTGDPSVPKGWYVDRRSNTSQRLYTRANKERGIPLLYSSDSYSDDLPYWVVSPLAEEGYEDEGLLIVPSSLDCGDWRFNASGQGWSSGKDWLRHLTDTFDALYEEGLEGEAKMMTVVLHPRICGRAGRTAALEQFVQYIQAKEGVWVPKREEIASFWREKFPYDPATAHGKLPKVKA
ncbi:hypothetical protein JCM10207_002185 [Rhodosporidiobolus poonsookiae]